MRFVKMAEDLKAFVSDKAEELSGVLKKLLTSGQDYVNVQFGVDLGLKPELYPPWVILSTALVALLVLLWVSWAAVCGGLLSGKKRGSPVTQGDVQPKKVNFVESTKPEEPRKRSKKKAPEKAQPNGQPVAVVPENVEPPEPVSKPQIKSVKAQQVQPVQAPLQVKKSKKKNKSDVKTLPPVSPNEGKEPDDGAWETKVSNREKRQQRKKEKDPEDSGGPEGVKVSKTQVEAPVVAGGSKTKRGNPDPQPPKTATKGDRAKGTASSNRKEEPLVTNGSRSDMSSKPSRQAAPAEKPKFSSLSAALELYRPQTEPQPRVQNSQGWSGIKSQMKTSIRPVSFTMPGLNSTDSLPNTSKLQWENQPNVDDEWSGFNGLSTGGSSSDWSAPAEHWGNYEETPVLQVPAPPQKRLPLLSKASDDEINADNPPGGAAKSKRKKKKKTEEKTSANAQTSPVNNITKASEAPVPKASTSQKKPEKIVEPPKPTQKKKIKRET